jgi:hypothetical protein
MLTSVGRQDLAIEQITGKRDESVLVREPVRLET